MLVMEITVGWQSSTYSHRLVWDPDSSRFHWPGSGWSFVPCSSILGHIWASWWHHIGFGFHISASISHVPQLSGQCRDKSPLERSEVKQSQWRHLSGFGFTASVSRKSAARGKKYSRTHLGGASVVLHLPDSWQITEVVTDPVRRKPGLHWYETLAPKIKSWLAILPLTGGRGIPQDMTRKKNKTPS